MPPKIKELIVKLEYAGFKNRGGKGSHRNFIHPNIPKPITLSGKNGDDAKHYQIRSVKIAIEESQRGITKMKDSAKYIKIVEWSEEDQCYVGSAPGLIFGGCHGTKEKDVFDELCQIVDETIELIKKEGKSLPPPTSGHDYVNKLHSVA